MVEFISNKYLFSNTLEIIIFLFILFIHLISRMHLSVPELLIKWIYYYYLPRFQNTYFHL